MDKINNFDFKKYISDSTGSDFAGIITSAINKTKYTLEKDSYALRFLIIDGASCDFGLLLYPKEDENNSKKKALLIPVKEDFVDKTGACFSVSVQVGCVYYDNKLKHVLNEACKILENRYKCNFSYLSKYSPYSGYILDDAFKNEESFKNDYEKIIENITVKEFLEKWKNENSEITSIYKKVDRNTFYQMLKPKIYIENTSTKSEVDIYKLVSNFWEFDFSIYSMENAFNDNGIKAKDFLRQIHEEIRKIYNNPLIVNVEERVLL